MKSPKFLVLAATLTAAVALLSAQNTPLPGAPQQTPQQPAPAPPVSQSEINFAIVGDTNAPLHYAIPDFIAAAPDADTVAAAKTMTEVLWDDLAFEREFDLIPRDTYRTIPQTQTLTD